MIETIKRKVSGLFSGDGEDRGVSPVIGVILMVTITVILAAVIGAFVLGLGGDLGSGTAPNTVLSVDSDTREEADGAGGTVTNHYVIVEHKQGESLEKGDLRLILRNGEGDSIGTIDDLTETGTLSIGDTMDQQVTSDDIGGNAVSTISGVDVVHVPSESVLASSTVSF